MSTETSKLTKSFKFIRDKFSFETKFILKMYRLFQEVSGKNWNDSTELERAQQC